MTLPSAHSTPVPHDSAFPTGFPAGPQPDGMSRPAPQAALAACTLREAFSCLSPVTQEALGVARTRGLPTDYALELVVGTLAEDLSWGPDVTTRATLGTTQQGCAVINSRESGRLAGVPLAAAAFELLSLLLATSESPHSAGGLQVSIQASDGEVVEPGSRVLTVSGPLHLILTAERSALNLLSQLSGVATATNSWVQALRGSATHVRDTRKTQPGLRIAQKYAVRCGGGLNHRMGLGDAALIKDNHIAAVGSLSAAVAAVRADAPDVALEVECDTLDQVREAVSCGVQLILLDNMTPAQVREAVKIARAAGVRTEASGGLSLSDGPTYAAAGVDFIAVGALTHSPRVLDLGLDIAPAAG